MDLIDAFRAYVGEWHDLETVQGLLGWDMETHMPEQGTSIRAGQMATLAKISHEMLSSQEMARFLDVLRDPAPLSGPIRVTRLLQMIRHWYERSASSLIGRLKFPQRWCGK
jgi:carboxypeptidase Taq